MRQPFENGNDWEGGSKTKRIRTVHRPKSFDVELERISKVASLSSTLLFWSSSEFMSSKECKIRMHLISSPFFLFLLFLLSFFIVCKPNSRHSSWHNSVCLSCSPILLEFAHLWLLAQIADLAHKFVCLPTQHYVLQLSASHRYPPWWIRIHNMIRCSIIPQHFIHPLTHSQIYVIFLFHDHLAQKLAIYSYFS